MSAVCVERVFEMFDMVRTRDLPKDQVRSLVCNVLIAMGREVEDAAATRLSDWERNEQLYCSSEMTAIVRAQRAVGAYYREVQLIAQRALAPTGMKVADLSPSSRDDLLDGAARALVERDRLYQLRLSDRLAPFVPNDPIFAQPSSAPTVPVDTPIGPTLGVAIDTYLTTKQRSWTKKTHVIRVRYITYLRQHFGADHPLASIVAADVRKYRDAIARLRKNSGVAVRQTFAEKQTASAAHRISDST